MSHINDAATADLRLVSLTAWKSKDGLEDF